MRLARSSGSLKYFVVVRIEFVAFDIKEPVDEKIVGKVGVESG